MAYLGALDVMRLVQDDQAEGEVGQVLLEF